MLSCAKVRVGLLAGFLSNYWNTELRCGIPNRTYLSCEAGDSISDKGRQGWQLFKAMPTSVEATLMKRGIHMGKTERESIMNRHDGIARPWQDAGGGSEATIVREAVL